MGLGSGRSEAIFNEERSFVELSSDVKFGDENLKKLYLELESGKFEDKVKCTPKNGQIDNEVHSFSMFENNSQLL